MLPLYLLRAMGAGDVKLMAMVGVFVGPLGALSVALLTFVAGGVLALAVAARNGALGRLFWNLKAMLLGSAVNVLSGGGASVDRSGGVGGQSALRRGDRGGNGRICGDVVAGGVVPDDRPCRPGQSAARTAPGGDQKDEHVVGSSGNKACSDRAVSDKGRTHHGNRDLRAKRRDRKVAPPR